MGPLNDVPVSAVNTRVVEVAVVLAVGLVGVLVVLALFSSFLVDCCFFFLVVVVVVVGGVVAMGRVAVVPFLLVPRGGFERAVAVAVASSSAAKPRNNSFMVLHSSHCSFQSLRRCNCCSCCSVNVLPASFAAAVSDAFFNFFLIFRNFLSNVCTYLLVGLMGMVAVAVVVGGGGVWEGDALWSSFLGLVVCFWGG